MLRNSLELLLIGLQLVTNQPSLPTPEQYIAQHQKPPIYAQFSGDARDEHIERWLGFYRNLISEPNIGKHKIEMALGFYNDVIKESTNNLYKAQAYLNSGWILCCMIDSKDASEGLRRLNEAYNLGGIQIQTRALYMMFDMAMRYEGSSEKVPNLKSPEHYVRQMDKLNQNDDLTKEAKKRLRQFRKQ